MFHILFKEESCKGTLLKKCSFFKNFLKIILQTCTPIVTWLKFQDYLPTLLSSISQLIFSSYF